jgi:hypothetical protein
VLPRVVSRAQEANVSCARWFLASPVRSPRRLIYPGGLCRGFGIGWNGRAQMEDKRTMAEGSLRFVSCTISDSYAIYAGYTPHGIWHFAVLGGLDCERPPLDNDHPPTGSQGALP